MKYKDFDDFCFRHVCAVRCRDRPDYCPIADHIRDRFGTITGIHCEAEYQRMKGENNELLRSDTGKC